MSEELATVDDGTVDHEELRKVILDRRKSIEEGYWELALDLHKVWNHTYHIEWGFESFQAYVEEELDFRVRTAQYMVSIADWFGKMGPQVQTWVRSLGWSKSKELVGRVTEENWKEWRKKVKGKTVSQLLALLKEDGGKEKEKEEDEVDGEKPKKRSFRLYESQMENVEQAIKKAKEDANSDSDNHALDLICTEYLATHQGKSGLAEIMAKYEKLYGVRLVAYNPTEDVIVYGDALLDDLLADDGAEATDDAEPEAEAS